MPKQTGGHYLTGSLEQIRQMHAPNLLWRERRDQQKQKQQGHKLRHKNKPSTSTITTIALIVSTTSCALPVTAKRAQTRAATTCLPVIIIFLLFRQKKEDGQCASQVPRKQSTCESKLGHKKRNVSDAFAFALFLELDIWQHLLQWCQRTANCNDLENRTAACTNLKETYSTKNWEY